MEAAARILSPEGLSVDRAGDVDRGAGADCAPPITGSSSPTSCCPDSRASTCWLGWQRPAAAAGHPDHRLRHDRERPARLQAGRFRLPAQAVRRPRAAGRRTARARLHGAALLEPVRAGARSARRRPRGARAAPATSSASTPGRGSADDVVEFGVAESWPGLIARDRRAAAARAGRAGHPGAGVRRARDRRRIDPSRLGAAQRHRYRNQSGGPGVLPTS